MEIKKTLSKIWDFIWNSNSIWSWIVCIILAFLLIKFLVYPGIGLVMGTSSPIVAVVSSSMEHNGDFDTWWDSIAKCSDSYCTQKNFYAEYNLTKEQFYNFRFRNGFNKGDLMFLAGSSGENINIGDIVVFESYAGDPIIHRVIKKWNQEGKYYFQTKGDANAISIYSAWLNELSVPEDKILGKVYFRLPLLGWVKIGFANLVNLI